MIARSFRFHGYNSLAHTYRHGQVLRSPLLMIRYEQNTKRRTGRVAVVVSKKVHKSAVVRNRIRRRIFEIVRRSQITSALPVDMVITIHEDRVATTPSAELEKTLGSLLGKINGSLQV